MFDTPQAEAFSAQDRETLKTGALLDLPEQTVNTRYKGVRMLHTKRLPILDEAGRPRYLVAISEDVTVRKQAEQALIEARNVAEQASRSKSEFLANMSHESAPP